MSWGQRQNLEIKQFVSQIYIHCACASSETNSCDMKTWQNSVFWSRDETMTRLDKARNRTSLTGRTGNMVILAIVIAVELSPSCQHPSCYVLCFACSNNLRNMCCGVGIEWNRQRLNTRGEAAQQISWVYTGLKQPVHIFKNTHDITLTSLMSV